MPTTRMKPHLHADYTYEAYPTSILPPNSQPYSQLSSPHTYRALLSPGCAAAASCHSLPPSAPTLVRCSGSNDEVRQIRALSMRSAARRLVPIQSVRSDGPAMRQDGPWLPVRRVTTLSPHMPTPSFAQATAVWRVTPSTHAPAMVEEQFSSYLSLTITLHLLLSLSLPLLCLSYLHSHSSANLPQPPHCSLSLLYSFPAFAELGSIISLEYLRGEVPEESVLMAQLDELIRVYEAVRSGGKGREEADAAGCGHCGSWMEGRTEDEA